MCYSTFSGYTVKHNVCAERVGDIYIGTSRQTGRQSLNTSTPPLKKKITWTAGDLIFNDEKQNELRERMARKLTENNNWGGSIQSFTLL